MRPSPAPSPLPETAERPTKPRAQAGGRTETLIGGLLRGGVLLSFLFVAVGLLVSFVRHPEYLSSLGPLERVLRTEHATRSLVSVGAGLAEGQGRAITMIGLLVLIATPISRVALSLVLFAQQRNRIFVGITALVLTLLLCSFLIGAVG